MSGYILCRTPMASVPYYIKNVGTNIYSIEELCYYLYQNLYLVDESLMNVGLCKWIGRELRMKELARRLSILMEHNTVPLEDFACEILRSINYLSQEEMRAYRNQICALEKQSVPVREKLKGDCLMENRKYVNAIRVYRTILEQVAGRPEHPRFSGSIYHNLGCAYSRLFQKEEALVCFEKAYEYLHTREALKHYLLAYSNAKTPIEYESRMAEMKVDEQTRKEIQDAISEFYDRTDIYVQEHGVEDLLSQMTKEYHHNTGA